VAPGPFFTTPLPPPQRWEYETHRHTAGLIQWLGDSNLRPQHRVKKMPGGWGGGGTREVDRVEGPVFLADDSPAGNSPSLKKEFILYNAWVSPSHSNLS